MFFLSQKSPFKKVELLSVNIPKTAGVSFRTILEDVYGKSLYKVYGATAEKFNHGKLSRIPASAKVLHGHFAINTYNRHLFPNAQIICWVRHPTDRLISHYNYWLTYPPSRNPIHNKFLREKPSLREFIENPAYQSTINNYHSFLGFLNPEDFLFIGRMEHFSKDLATLSHKLNWPSIPQEIPVENIGSKKPLPNDISREEITALLSTEVKIYQQLITYFHS